MYRSNHKRYWAKLFFRWEGRVYSAGRMYNREGVYHTAGHSTLQTQLFVDAPICYDPQRTY